MFGHQIEMSLIQSLTILLIIGRPAALGKFNPGPGPSWPMPGYATGGMAGWGDRGRRRREREREREREGEREKEGLR